MAMNRPIESPVKSHRFDMDELIYHTCWAYMRELRTHNSTKQILPVDPYAEVYRFRENLYGIFSENIDGKGDVWSWLILGPEKALLIDTGFGLGDLKGLVNELIGDRELLVANTHFHPDHAGGNCQFDRVYALEQDALMLEKNKTKPLLNEKILNPDGSCRCVEFDVKDMIAQKDYEVVPIPDEFVFDLGDGYEIETIRLAGHTAGQAAFLDRKGRTLFPGDDIIAMRVGIGGRNPGTLREFAERMHYLESRVDEFDAIFPGHFIADIDAIAVHDMVETLTAILADPENYDYTEPNSWGGVTLCKAVHGLGCIGYSKEGI